MKLTLPFNPFFLLTTSLCHFVYAMDCPSTVYVELGNDGILNCQILNNGDIYWYKGNSTKTSPIVRLENGQKKISHESYDMDEEGSLIIKKIEEQNYGLYSVVNFYANDKHDTDQVKVEIAVKSQTCPVITGCNDCTHCVLTETEGRTISCSIAGIRPLVHLSIIIESKNNVQVIRNVSEETYDPLADTWNTTTTIEYSKWYDCTSPLQFRCVTGNKDPLQLSDSVVNITSDSCKTTTQMSGFQTPLLNGTNRLNVFGITIIIGAIFVLLAFVILILLCGKKAILRNRRRSKECSEGENTELLKATKRQALVQSFIDRLKREYQRNREFSFTLTGQCSTIDDFFTGISFTLKKKNGGTSIISSSNLMKELFGNEKRFVFIGDGDFGRKSFMQFICSRLSEENLDQEIIFFLNLSGLHNDMNIIDAINSKMGLEEEFTADALQEILDTRKSLFVFDAVQELKPKEPPSKASEITDIAELNINSFLTSSDLLQRFPNVHCLYLVNHAFKQTTVSTEPHVLVEYRPFSKEYVNKYIRRVFTYYNKASDRTIGQEVETVKGDHNSSSNVGGRPNFEHAATHISKLVLDEKGISKEMCICPALLILFIHVLVSDITKKNINDLYFYVNRLTYLTSSIVSCLQFQHSQYQDEGEDFNHLMVKLGQLSFKKKLNQISFANCELISTFKRIDCEEMMGGYEFSRAYSIGILKLEGNGNFRNDTEEDILSPDSKVAFLHCYVQEFLAANAIAADKATLKKFLQHTCDIENDRMKRVIQFIYAHELNTRQEILEGFIKDAKWNILIDCLFESEDSANFEAIQSKLSAATVVYSVNIIQMDQHYHCMAVTRFCKYLAKYKVSLRALSFKRGCKLEVFSQLQVYSVKYLAFIEMDFKDEKDFTFFVKTACQMNVLKSVQFLKCQFPENVSNQAIRDSLRKIASEKAPGILRAETLLKDPEDTNVKWYRLNFDKGCWDLLRK